MRFIHIKVICGVLYVRCRGGVYLMIEKPNSSIRCGLFGHKWEEWTPHPLYNIVGVPYTFRNCFRCNAQNYKVL